MWLGEEEQLILRYLQQLNGAGATAREICRKAGTKDRWKENERWADPFLRSLRDKGLIETDAGGHYKLVKQAEE